MDSIQDSHLVERALYMACSLRVKCLRGGYSPGIIGLSLRANSCARSAKN